jgi:hypothetical protein
LRALRHLSRGRVVNHAFGGEIVLRRQRRGLSRKYDFQFSFSKKIPKQDQKSRLSVFLYVKNE